MLEARLNAGARARPFGKNNERVFLFDGLDAVLNQFGAGVVAYVAGGEDRGLESKRVRQSGFDDAGCIRDFLHEQHDVDERRVVCADQKRFRAKTLEVSLKAAFKAAQRLHEANEQGKAFLHDASSGKLALPAVSNENIQKRANDKAKG